MGSRTRHGKQASAFFGALALAFCGPVTAFAQSNYEGVQLGGRTSMMGGAAVATGEDQATAFINPAGITRIPGQSLSFSTFAATVKLRTMQSSLDASARLGLSESNVSKVKLRVLPNTFCLFLDGPPKDETSGRSRHKYALCAASTEREVFDFAKNQNDVDFTSGEVSGTSHSTSMEFVRSTLALSWGLSLDRDTSIGVTSRIDNARLNDRTITTSFQSEDSAGRMQTLAHSLSAWSWDNSLVVGLTSNISRVVTLGASMTTPSQHLVGKFTGSSSIASTGGQPHSVTQDNGDFRYNHPGSVRMGLAFSWPRFVFEIDGSFYGPQKQLARANFDRTTSVVQSSGAVADSGGVGGSSQRASVSERGKPVTNLSFGAEYFFESDFSIVSGIQTDFSGIHPRVTSAPTDVLFRQNKDSIHAAVGVSSYGEGGRLLLGLRGHYAKGQILVADAALNEPQFVALNQTEWGLSVVISGSISFNSVRDAAVKATNPLTQAGDERDEEEQDEPPARRKQESR